MVKSLSKDFFLKESDGTPPKPVYAASQLEWGAFRDAQERKTNYWYWGSLKKYITFLFSSYKGSSPLGE